jgi:hypothetical protein
MPHSQHKKEGAGGGWNFWSDEEDRLVLEARARFGGDWAAAAMTLPGRSGQAIKTRYYQVVAPKELIKARRVRGLGIHTAAVAAMAAALAAGRGLHSSTTQLNLSHF